MKLQESEQTTLEQLEEATELIEELEAENKHLNIQVSHLNHLLTDDQAANFSRNCTSDLGLEKLVRSNERRVSIEKSMRRRLT